MIIDVGLVRQHPDQCGDHRRGAQDAFGAAAFEGQLGRHLTPAVALDSEQVVVVDEHLVEGDLVEVMFTGE